MDDGAIQQKASARGAQLGRLALWAAAALGLSAGASLAERGSDGALRIHYWQAISTLNPYVSGGAKDAEAASLVLEPLAGFDEKGMLFPRLAAAIPTVENGGLAADRRQITWTLRPELRWSDGTAVTAADVVFTYEYCQGPKGGCAQSANFEGIEKIEALGPQSVQITFSAPKPNPYLAFVGANMPILQKAQFTPCLKAIAACEAQNARPLGTGPFQVIDFKVNDHIALIANPYYRDPAKPAFATVLLTSGGDAESAARAVMETGEYDYAWNTQITPALQSGLSASGKGVFVTAFGGLVERIDLNLTDPAPHWPEGERATRAHPHPFLTDPKLRAALSRAIDRQALVDLGYGAAGRPICQLVPAPAPFAATDRPCPGQDLEGARALLEAAGWRDIDGDGLREKNGQRLRLLFQTSTNPVRQSVQLAIKDWWRAIGVDVALKIVDAGVFFGSDPHSPDTFQRFYADVEMYANTFTGTDPAPYLSGYRCARIPDPSTDWQGENVIRFCDPSYEALMDSLAQTLDPSARGALIQRLDARLTAEGQVIIPLVDRGRLSAQAQSLGGHIMTAWDSELWNVQDWYRRK